MVQEIDIMIIDDSRHQVIDREFVIQISSNTDVLDTATITILENDGELIFVHIGKSIDYIKQLSHFFGCYFMQESRNMLCQQFTLSITATFSLIRVRRSLLQIWWLVLPHWSTP